MRRAAYAWLILAFAPVLAALWTWPAGVLAMAAALLLGRWPAILAALPSTRRRARLAKLQTQWESIR